MDKSKQSSGLSTLIPLVIRNIRGLRVNFIFRHGKWTGENSIDYTWRKNPRQYYIWGDILKINRYPEFEFYVFWTLTGDDISKLDPRDNWSKCIFWKYSK